MIGPQESEVSLDPRFKCLDRLNSQLIRLEALEAGYDDAVWLDGHGYVAEAAASNIFVVKNDEIFTPQTGILRGITRATVLELAERGGGAGPARERAGARHGAQEEGAGRQGPGLRAGAVVARPRGGFPARDERESPKTAGGIRLYQRNVAPLKSMFAL